MTTQRGWTNQETSPSTLEDLWAAVARAAAEMLTTSERETQARHLYYNAQSAAQNAKTALRDAREAFDKELDRIAGTRKSG